MSVLYRRVAERAGHRCEYCRDPEAIFGLPVLNRASIILGNLDRASNHRGSSDESPQPISRPASMDAARALPITRFRDPAPPNPEDSIDRASPAQASTSWPTSTNRQDANLRHILHRGERRQATKRVDQPEA